MGCCYSRNSLVNSIGKRSLFEYIEKNNLDSFSCSDIKRLDAQILSDKLEFASFDMLAKSWNIKASFEFFAIRGSIYKFELKATLLLFSKESYVNKELIFFEMINDNKRNLMRFLECRYQLINERIPIELSRMN